MGEFLAQIPLPCVDNALTGLWKGFDFERRPMKEHEGSLCGNKKPSELLIHLTLDAPPQIWTFVIVEDEESRGRFAFSECAGVASF